MSARMLLDEVNAAKGGAARLTLAANAALTGEAGADMARADVIGLALALGYLRTAERALGEAAFHLGGMKLAAATALRDAGRGPEF